MKVKQSYRYVIICCAVTIPQTCDEAFPSVSLYGNDQEFKDKYVNYS